MQPQPSLQSFRPPPPKDFMGIPRPVWLIACGLAIVLAFSYLGYVAWDKSSDLDKARAEAEAARSSAALTEGELATLKDQMAALQEKASSQQELITALNSRLTQEQRQQAEAQARIAALQKEKEATVQSRRSLEDEMRAALKSKDVTISQLQGKLTVNILDRIMFESGEAVLKPDGEAVLRKVADVLSQHPALKIHVIGHTDNVPLRPGARFASNWELSSARAISAVRFLSEKAGIDPRRLGAIGYGEFRPIAENSTPEGRAKNRRIAITVLSEELAGSDAVPVSVAPAINAAVLSAGSSVPTNATAPVETREIKPND